jgi:DNA-binding LacI/PurR family transcriptional regulator
MRERLDGFLRAMEENGLSVLREWIVPSELSVNGGQLAMRKLISLQDPPKAVFINNNLLGLGALLELQEKRLRCPQDIGLVMFDDHPWARVSEPPLTVICQPAAEVGRTAARLLLQKMRNGDRSHQDVILPCELIVRGSCK